VCVCVMIGRKQKADGDPKMLDLISNGEGIYRERLKIDLKIDVPLSMYGIRDRDSGREGMGKRSMGVGGR
jgi:hypothetical protein